MSTELRKSSYLRKIKVLHHIQQGYSAATVDLDPLFADAAAFEDLINDFRTPFHNPRNGQPLYDLVIAVDTNKSGWSFLIGAAVSYAEKRAFIKATVNTAEPERISDDEEASPKSRQSARLRSISASSSAFDVSLATPLVLKRSKVLLGMSMSSPRQTVIVTVALSFFVTVLDWIEDFRPAGAIIRQLKNIPVTIEGIATIRCNNERAKQELQGYKLVELWTQRPGTPPLPPVQLASVRSEKIRDVLSESESIPTIPVKRRRINIPEPATGSGVSDGGKTAPSTTTTIAQEARPSAMAAEDEKESSESDKDKIIVPCPATSRVGHGRPSLEPDFILNLAQPIGDISEGASSTASNSGSRGRTPSSTTNILSHSSASYEANNPIEDRQAHATASDGSFSVLCVFDGHGGYLASQYMSKHLPKEVLKRVSPDSTTGQLTAALKEAFLHCDEKFIEYLFNLPVEKRQAKGFANAGTCAIVSLIGQGKLLVANCGDCRAVLGTMNSLNLTPYKGRTSSCLSTRAVTASNGIKSDEKAIKDAVEESNSVKIIENKKRKKGPTEDEDESNSEDGGPSLSREVLKAIHLSNDHNCQNANEVRLVRNRSNDRNAIRSSIEDQRLGVDGVRRVAGSLAVTRALGDAYLKRTPLSRPPFANKLPYITAEPEVTVHVIQPEDRFLILASDGLWDILSSKKAVSIVSNHIKSVIRGTGTSASPSQALIDFCLDKLSKAHGLTLEKVKNLPQGRMRRRLHDDITCTVVVLQNSWPVASPASEPPTTPAASEDSQESICVSSRSAAAGQSILATRFFKNEASQAFSQ